MSHVTVAANLTLSVHKRCVIVPSTDYNYKVAQRLLNSSKLTWKCIILFRNSSFKPRGRKIRYVKAMHLGLGFRKNKTSLQCKCQLPILSSSFNLWNHWNLCHLNNSNHNLIHRKGGGLPLLTSSPCDRGPSVSM